jgi:hypothetical protein
MINPVNVIGWAIIANSFSERKRTAAARKPPLRLRSGYGRYRMELSPAFCLIVSAFQLCKKRFLSRSLVS